MLRRVREDCFQRLCLTKCRTSWLSRAISASGGKHPCMEVTAELNATTNLAKTAVRACYINYTKRGSSLLLVETTVVS